jgi:hypothetical protein
MSHTSNAMSRERAIDEMLSKQTIYDVLCRYCHGVNRCDVDVLKSVYWPEAYEAHETINGSAWDFAEYMTGMLRAGSIGTTQ